LLLEELAEIRRFLEPTRRRIPLLQQLVALGCSENTHFAQRCLWTLDTLLDQLRVMRCKPLHGRAIEQIGREQQRAGQRSGRLTHRQRKIKAGWHNGCVQI
jgi:hypothetical protein